MRKMNMRGYCTCGKRTEHAKRRTRELKQARSAKRAIQGRNR